MTGNRCAAVIERKRTEHPEPTERAVQISGYQLDVKPAPGFVMATGNQVSLHSKLMSDTIKSISLILTFVPLWRSVANNAPLQILVADMHQRLDANAFHLRTSPWPRMTVQQGPQWPFLPFVESSKTAAPPNRGQRQHMLAPIDKKNTRTTPGWSLEAHRGPIAPGIAS